MSDRLRLSVWSALLCGRGTDVGAWSSHVGRVRVGMLLHWAEVLHPASHASFKHTTRTLLLPGGPRPSACSFPDVGSWSCQRPGLWSWERGLSRVAAVAHCGGRLGNGLRQMHLWTGLGVA